MARTSLEDESEPAGHRPESVRPWAVRAVILDERAEVIGYRNHL